MSKPIFIINGSGGKGKDAFVKCCSKFTWVVNISTVDKVKEAARTLGWEDDKSEEGREFLSDLKLRADKYCNHSFTYVSGEVKKFLNSEYDNIMFIHCREPENIETLTKTFKCKTILIVNINIDDITTNMADANVNNYEYDYYIDNSGTLDDLEFLAKDFVENKILE